MSDKKPLVTDLRHRVEFQSVSNADDGAGGSVETWTTDLTVWADVRATKGFEKFMNDQRDHRMDVKVVIRYTADAAVNTKSRIKFGDRIFRILSIRNLDERNRYFIIECEERKS